MSASPSRYARVERAILQSADGRSTPYLRRRIIPPGDPAVSLPTATLGADTRLDLVAARLLGDPLQAWRLADANGLPDLADPPANARLRVPRPGA